MTTAKASVATGGVQGVRGTNGTGNRQQNAQSAFQMMKSKGKQVAWFNSSSAAHKFQNPNSNHDMALAFHFHESGPSAVQEAMRIPGAAYLINRSTAYNKVSNGKWTSKPYGGYFKSGKEVGLNRPELDGGWEMLASSSGRLVGHRWFLVCGRVDTAPVSRPAQRQHRCRAIQG